MKYHWEPEDITPGRRVEAHNRSEQYIIGYDGWRDKDQGHIVLVSLADGMLTIKDCTHQAMADQLNKNEMRPVDVPQ